MPIYEYVCEACGADFELMQKFDAPAPDECEKCHKGPVHKKISRTGFILKGGGWYVTDFRGGGSTGKTSAAETKPETKTETTAAPATESKPADTKSDGGGTKTAAS